MSNVTIKYVAKTAGVAVSTVSRVINNHADVKKETKEHVLKVIKELNYIPNNSARNLKRTNSNSIGIFVIGEYNPFFGDIVETLESEISSNGFAAMVHFHHSDEKTIESAAQFMLEKKLLGLIFLGGVVTKEDEGYLKSLKAPVVFTSTVIEDDINRELFSSVRINEFEAVDKIMSHLIKLGHSKIGIITAEELGSCASPERLSAYEKILTQNSMYFDSNFIARGDYTMSSGYEAMTELLKNRVGITAVFAVNDLMAIGATKAIFDCGLNVPGDISVIGFDGLDYGKYLNPSLTTLKQSNIDFGKISWKILSKQVENPKSEVEHIVVETEFLERDSCKPFLGNI